MELDGHVDRLLTEFAAISEVAGPEVREVAERLVTPLDSVLRLVLLEALAAAADEITSDLAPGSVHLRLRGVSPDFVVTPASPGPAAPEEPQDTPALAPLLAPSTDTEGGTTARINFRPPESLKARIEQAAHRDGLSVNTWLSRVAAAAIDQSATRATTAERGRTARGGWFA